MCGIRGAAQWTISVNVAQQSSLTYSTLTLSTNKVTTTDHLTINIGIVYTHYVQNF